MRAPPHQNSPPPPLAELRLFKYMAVIQGHWPSFESAPPTMRPVRVRLPSPQVSLSQGNLFSACSGPAML